MFNYDDDEDPIGQFRTSRILNPIAQRNMSQIQDATASPDTQFSDAFKPASSSLDGVEELAAKSGGVFFDKDNMRRYMDAINANETAPKPRQNALTQHLANQPSREDYEPSTRGKIGAALVGFGTGYREGPSAGIKAGKAAIDAPYLDARQDWMDKTGPLEYGANLEEKGVKDRTAGLIRNASMGVKFDEESRKRNKDAAELNKTNIEIKNIESEINNRDNGYIDAPFPDAKTGNMMILKKSKGGVPVPVNLGVTSLAWDEFQNKKKQEGVTNEQKNREIGIAGRNASANESRAASAATSAATGQANLTERQAEDDRVLPVHRLEAQQAALKELRNYPAFAPFIRSSEAGHMEIAPFNPDTMNFNIHNGFIDELQKRTERIIGEAKPKRIPRDKN